MAKYGKIAPNVVIVNINRHLRTSRPKLFPTTAAARSSRATEPEGKSSSPLSRIAGALRYNQLTDGRFQVQPYILQGFVIKSAFSLKVEPFHWR